MNFSGIIEMDEIPAILNKLLHQFAHEAVGKIMLAFFITEPVYRELLSDI